MNYLYPSLKNIERIQNVIFERYTMIGIIP